MRGIIWYYTKREVGMEKLEQLVSNYVRMGIKLIKLVNNKVISEAIFDNGDYWKVCSSYQNSRGQSCNIALIERNTPEEIINTIIKPCIKSLPYNAYNYY